MKKLFGGRGVGFDPTPFRFPEIQVDTLASNLNVDRRGARDGKENVPPSGQASLSSSELDIVGDIDRKRREALNKFEIELEAYSSRIAAAKTERQNIELLVGQAENDFKNNVRVEENHLENARELVSGLQEKLRDFKAENGISGPPRASAKLLPTVALILMAGGFETALNTFFFQDQNELGILGGFMLALTISSVNVSASFLGGVWTRQVYLAPAIRKLFGSAILLFTITFAIALNLMVAHFRDALASAEWNEAMFLALKSFKAGVFDLDSAYSWLIFATGCIVSIVAFLKGNSYFDKIPGFNRLWNDTQKAIARYSHEYEEAQEELDRLFEAAKAELEKQAQMKRASVKGAIDALFAQSGLIRGLDVFLENSDQAANRLLRRYREANQKARTDPAPKYFDDPFSLVRYDTKGVRKAKTSQEEAEEEIEKIQEVVSEGVEKLLAARRNSLNAFPTIQEIKGNI